MFRYCLNDTRKNLPIWWFLLSGAIYLVSCLPYRNSVKLYNISLPEYIIICFSNSYYFLLILLPLIFIVLLRLQWGPPTTVMSRTVLFSNYLKARSLTLLFFLAIIVTFHLAFTIIMGLGLPYSSNNILLDTEYSSLLLLFVNHFGSIWLSVCAILLNYLLGLYCLSLIVGTIILYLPKRIATIAIVLLYLIIFIGVQRSATWNATPFFIGNYMILSTAISSNLFPWSIGVLLALCILLIEVMNKKWWRSKTW